MNALNLGASSQMQRRGKSIHVAFLALFKSGESYSIHTTHNSPGGANPQSVILCHEKKSPRFACKNCNLETPR